MKYYYNHSIYHVTVLPELYLIRSYLMTVTTAMPTNFYFK